jgi:hypothetical protein
MLGSVTVRSFAQLSGMIMSEIGGDLEGYGLLNVARSEEPINELPQEPVLVLRLTPPQAKGNHSSHDFFCSRSLLVSHLNYAESTPISDKSRHRQTFSEQVKSSSHLSTSYESYCRRRAKMYVQRDKVVAQLKESSSVSRTLHDLLPVSSTLTYFQTFFADCLVAS